MIPFLSTNGKAVQSCGLRRQLGNLGILPKCCIIFLYNRWWV